MTTATMNPAASLVGRLSLALRDARYVVERTGLVVGTNLVIQAFHRILGQDDKSRPIPRAAELRVLRRRFTELLERDLANVKAGYYPDALLFDTELLRHLAQVPRGIWEFPRVLRRARKKRHDDLPDDVDLSRYPRYYRRTFHWQSGGWLTDRSAELYDPGVELLFGYTGDVMRRMILPDVVSSVADLAAPRIADLACGTGRLLRQLHAALPNARLYGVDMSPNYIRHARKELVHVPDLNLVSENAEVLPFTDSFFDALTMTYLLHELPKDARRNVLSEALRVVKPGGVLGIVASPQYIESEAIRVFLDAFPRLYHEPYYKGYLRDPVEHALAEVGFEVIDTRDAFLSKVVIARRPA